MSDAAQDGRRADLDGSGAAEPPKGEPEPVAPPPLAPDTHMTTPAPEQAPAAATHPGVISIALPKAPGDAGPSEPVVVAPRPGQASRAAEEPVPAVAVPSSDPRSRGASGGVLATALDWQTGATVGTFLFVLCVVYAIVICLLGSTTLVAPALVVALIGAAVAGVSMARSRHAP